MSDTIPHTESTMLLPESNQSSDLLRNNNKTASATTRGIARKCVWTAIASSVIVFGILQMWQSRQASPRTFHASFQTISTPRLGSSRPGFSNRQSPSSTCPPNLESVLLLMRHCEDGSTKRQPDLSRHCNLLGFERAEYVATLFGSRWPPPSHLYGLAKGLNMRQYETLLPLANHFNLTIQMLDYPTSIDRLVGAHVHNLVEACQSTRRHPPIIVTVVAWKHAFIPKLAKALGCDHCPHDWSDNDFDSVWELHYRWANDDNDERPQYPSGGSWQVYSSLVWQNFDPLAYKYKQQ